MLKVVHIETAHAFSQHLSWILLASYILSSTVTIPNSNDHMIFIYIFMRLCEPLLAPVPYDYFFLFVLMLQLLDIVTIAQRIHSLRHVSEIWIRHQILNSFGPTLRSCRCQTQYALLVNVLVCAFLHFSIYIFSLGHKLLCCVYRI